MAEKKNDEELIKQGCLDIWIDDIVPCLKETKTWELKDTVVFKIESRSYLKKFNKENERHINSEEVPKDVEVYALALLDTNEIQGLIGLKDEKMLMPFIYIGLALHLKTISMILEARSMKE